MGAHFEALDEGVLLVLLDPRYTQAGFNLVSVQVWSIKEVPLCAQLTCIGVSPITTHHGAPDKFLDFWGIWSKFWKSLD